MSLIRIVPGVPIAVVSGLARIRVVAAVLAAAFQILQVLVGQFRVVAAALDFFAVNGDLLFFVDVFFLHVFFDDVFLYRGLFAFRGDLFAGITLFGRRFTLDPVRAFFLIVGFEFVILLLVLLFARDIFDDAAQVDIHRRAGLRLDRGLDGPFNIGQVGGSQRPELRGVARDDVFGRVDEIEDPKLSGGRIRLGADGREVVGQNDRLAAGRHRDLPVDDGEAESLAIGGLNAGDLSCDDRTANPDGGDRGRHLHVVRIVLGDLAGYEQEAALEDREGGLTGLRAGVIDHFVQRQARVGAQRENRPVDESDLQRPAIGGFDLVALKDRIASLQQNPSPVRTDGIDFPGQGIDRSDRIALGLGDLFVGQRRRLSGRHRHQEGIDQFRCQTASELADDIRRRIGGEIVLDQDRGAVRLHQQQV